MSWSAKPSGGYGISSDEAIGNMQEIVNLLGDSWTMEAMCGMMGVMYGESGMNPWRWQSDAVDLTSSVKGYGLMQFTPAYGYINNYGVSIDYFAPNLSVTEVTAGAAPTDGRAQIYVIDNDVAGKFINRSSWCDYYDISGFYPLSTYKQQTNLYGCTVAWLFHYGGGANMSESVAELRYSYAATIYELLTGYEPTDPDSSTDSYTDPEIVEDDSDSRIIKITPLYSEVEKGETQQYRVRSMKDIREVIEEYIANYENLSYDSLYWTITYSVTLTVYGSSNFEVEYLGANQYSQGTYNDTYTDFIFSVTPTTKVRGNRIYIVIAEITECKGYFQCLSMDEADPENTIVELELNMDFTGEYSTAYLKVLDADDKKSSSLVFNRPKTRIFT